MVKPDVKHNYYADLELPTTCTVEDVKKQYRKLALQYHPDRNAGREEEFVPKFQAIQTAIEVLGDATSKNKYDADRRKVGLYPPARPGQQANPTGNPYSATSAYPAPPRRTQPNTYQRPQPASGSYFTTPTGADRFTSFTRAAPTARKDAGGPAADRANNFRAWQNLNTAQEKEKRDGFTYTRPAPPPPPTMPSPNRPRPPPRQDTKLPSEEEIRAGMKHRQAEDVDARQSAWAAFQRSPGMPAVGRSNTTRTPKKQGFDPNAPGSDERACADGGYAHMHRRSEDFSNRQQGSMPPPPPPPGPPPMSPSSPTSSRPLADPLRPFKAREDSHDDQVPYAEGTRVRTPYSSVSGERTPFTRESSDGLRRSTSTRDATRLFPGGKAGRARSTSPLSRQAQANPSSSSKSNSKTFVDYSDSDASPEEESTSQTNDDITSSNNASRPDTAPHPKTPFERPLKVPTPPSRRFNGSTAFFSPPVDGAHSDNDMPGMQQKTANNMYDSPSLEHDDATDDSNSELCGWAAHTFGTVPTYGAERRKPRVPAWAYPSSVFPGIVRSKTTEQVQNDLLATSTGARKASILASMVDLSPASVAQDEEHALEFVKQCLTASYGEAPSNFDREVLMKLASTAREQRSCGKITLDNIMARTLQLFPSLALPQLDMSFANSLPLHDSFTYPGKQTMFTPTRNRSEENVNTTFSPDGWSGQFKGSDYFAPPPPTSRKQPSPSRKPKSELRSATANPPGSTSEANGAQQSSRTDAEETAQQDPQATPGGVKFSKEEWEQTIKEPSWMWPPPPPNPPSPTKAGKTSSRKASRSTTRSQASGASQAPTGVSGNENQGPGSDEQSTANMDDVDAMDIDMTPPAQSKHSTPQDQAAATNGTGEPRLYSVRPSAWRQQQEIPTDGAHQNRRASNTSATKGTFATNLDDLTHVEPLARDPNAGLDSLSGIGSTLPFTSKASASLPTAVHEPQKLQMPPVPKAPEVPHKLTKDSWHTHTADFAAYCQAYHAFNTTMVAHFAAREDQAQAQIQSGTAWLEAVGDTTATMHAPTGFGGYLRGVVEDEMVRETWNLGCERHKVAVEEFGRLRGRVRKLVVEGGGLR
ncbi:hypothetical protein LTR62_008216 [Meristemomyces frigidus]|uniref:J domain-containing protein n=1 Tax=Meristemomyces frigidus TaxID=1508187 RepID=A0AAN7TI98_9PEZI|nr:hypothetical protein LTR62_008216 [Meristemomyces frigidus]